MPEKHVYVSLMTEVQRVKGVGDANVMGQDYSMRPDGSLVYFKGRSMDDMMAGSVIVWAYQQTKEEKFRKAADIIRKSYDDYPRTSDGVFWHGRGTVGQIWVDGVFMGQMFLTKYGHYIGDTDYCFNEASRQLIGMYTHLKKGESGLLYHGWDEDKDAPLYLASSTHFRDYSTMFFPIVKVFGLLFHLSFPFFYLLSSRVL